MRCDDSHSLAHGKSLCKESVGCLPCRYVERTTEEEEESVSVKLFAAGVIEDINLQRCCTEEVKPSPRSSGWWQRNQVSIAPGCCLLLAGLIRLKNSGLLNLLQSTNRHDAVERSCPLPLSHSFRGTSPSTRSILGWILSFVSTWGLLSFLSLVGWH